MKKLVLTILLFASLLPQPSLAQIDQRCWIKEDCEAQAIGGVFHQTGETKQICGTPEGKDSAEREIGFCLPAGTIETATAFGGTRRFESIGDFIKFFYRYGIAVAGILALIMIIVAGVQRMMAGGSPDKVGASNKRIGAAISGLILAVLSYVVLQTINPALVNFRLPQIFMINAQSLAAPTCSEVKGKKIAKASEPGQKLKTADKENKFKTLAKDAFEDAEKTEATCGAQYFVEGTGGQTCMGTFCGAANQVCAPDENGKQACIVGHFIVDVFNTSIAQYFPDIITEAWTDPWIDPGETELHGLCTDGETLEIPVKEKVKNLGKKTQRSSISLNIPKADIAKRVESKCGSTDASDFHGFYFIFEMNENFDPTDEDQHVGMLGRDLGDPGAFNYLKKEGNQMFKDSFWSLEDVEKGFHLSMDVGKLLDIDDDGDRKEAYCYLGYKNAGGCGEHTGPKGYGAIGGAPTTGSSGGSSGSGTGSGSSGGSTGGIQGSGIGACFVAGTNIRTPYGEKNIEDIAVGDVLTTWNEETNQLTTSTVTELIRPLHDDIVAITFEHTKNTNTFDHPYYIIDKGWSSYKPELTEARYTIGHIQQLEVGDVALWHNGNKLVESQIVDMTEQMGEVQTYIFSLDENPTFFANDILTHNKIN